MGIAQQKMFSYLMSITEKPFGNVKVAGAKPRREARRSSNPAEAWHYDPGYEVILAMEEPDATARSAIASHIRDGLSRKDTLKISQIKDSDGAHERQISLIKERHEAEETARLWGAMGGNICQAQAEKNTDINCGSPFL